MKFYLAGPVGYGTPGVEWKESLKHMLRKKGHEVYDPIENDHRYARVKEMNEMKSNPKEYWREIHSIMQEIFRDDCVFITECDYIICYFVGKSFGTISEQGIAYYAKIFHQSNVQTLCIFEPAFVPDEWILGCADYTFFSLADFISFAREKWG